MFVHFLMRFIVLTTFLFLVTAEEVAESETTVNADSPSQIIGCAQGERLYVLNVHFTARSASGQRCQLSSRDVQKIPIFVDTIFKECFRKRQCTLEFDPQVYIECSGKSRIDSFTVAHTCVKDSQVAKFCTWRRWSAPSGLLLYNSEPAKPLIHNCTCDLLVSQPANFTLWRLHSTQTGPIPSKHVVTTVQDVPYRVDQHALGPSEVFKLLRRSTQTHFRLRITLPSEEAMHVFYYNTGPSGSVNLRCVKPDGNLPRIPVPVTTEVPLSELPDLPDLPTIPMNSSPLSTVAPDLTTTEGKDGSPGLSKEVLIGIICGGVGLLLLIVIIVVVCCLRRRKSRRKPPSAAPRVESVEDSSDRLLGSSASAHAGATALHKTAALRPPGAVNNNTHAGQLKACSPDEPPPYSSSDPLPTVSSSWSHDALPTASDLKTRHVYDDVALDEDQTNIKKSEEDPAKKALRPPNKKRTDLKL